MASGRVPFDGARLDDGASRPPTVPAWQSSLRHELGRLRTSRRRVIARFDATRQLSTPPGEGSAESWDRYVDTQVRNLTSEAVITSIGDNLDQAVALLDASAKAPLLRRFTHAGGVYESALGCLHRGRESLFLVEDDAWVGAQLPTLRAGVATTMGSDDPRTESYLRYLDDLMRAVADGTRSEPRPLGGARLTSSGTAIAPAPPIAPVPSTPVGSTPPPVTAVPSVPGPTGPSSGGMPTTATVTFGAGARESLRAIQTAIDDARLAAQIAVRVYRNALVAAIGLLTFAAIVFPVVAGTVGQTSATLSNAPKAVASVSSAGSASASAAATSEGATATSAPAAVEPTGSSTSGSSTSGGQTPGTPTVGALPPGAGTGTGAAVAATASPTVAASASTSPEPVADTGSSTATELQFTTSYLSGVEVWGLLGSLVAVIAGLWRLRSTRQPSGLQIAQLVLKLPAGALTAVFGVLLLQGGIVLQLQPARLGQVPAYAILFGFAQEGLTRFVDGKANSLLENAKPLSDKAG